MGGGLSPAAAKALAGSGSVASAAAITATADAPAGGTGTAAGGWDTAGNRNSAITTINQMRADIIAVRTAHEALLAALKEKGIVV